MDKELYVFLFNVGQIDFFTKMSVDDVVAGVKYKEVYWAHKESTVEHGPFPSIHTAMADYTGVVQSESSPQPETTEEKPIAPVVYVDFALKKRIQHG